MESLLHYKDAIISRTNSFLMERKSVRLNRHIVVFESDDWGSIRMPSLEVFESLKTTGTHISNPNTMDRLDTLASNDDLSALIEVLCSVKDKNGNPAKITLDTVVGNPDFDKIKQSDYQEYFFEPFVNTLNSYPHHNKSFELWQEGIKLKCFRPQFHGREHLNVQRWLKSLRNGNIDALNAFQHRMYSVRINGIRLLPAYLIESESEKLFVEKAICEGLDCFEKLFGYKSKSMIAPCYTWDDFVEKTGTKQGVSIIQGVYEQKHSDFDKNKVSAHYMGQNNHYGQVYLTRNCSFEPSLEKNYDAGYCVRQICKHFKAGRPAVVSCHRVNFIGDLVEKNRTENLKDFSVLLKQIVKLWPDVEFMSSDELGDMLLQQ